jgi:hypothetical protein
VQLLQRLEQPEVAGGGAPRLGRLELHEEVKVARRGVETVAGRRAEELEAPRAEAPAEFCQLVARGVDLYTRPSTSCDCASGPPSPIVPIRSISSPRRCLSSAGRA